MAGLPRRAGEASSEQQGVGLEVFVESVIFVTPSDWRSERIGGGTDDDAHAFMKARLRGARCHLLAVMPQERPF